MKYGARNKISAEVIEIKKGDVMCQVKVKLSGSEHTMTSVMTVDSLNDLGLGQGDTVNVLAKAVNVLLTKE